MKARPHAKAALHVGNGDEAEKDQSACSRFAMRTPLDPMRISRI
jgi:hypothetical protein